PVGQRRSAERHALPRPDLLLPRQGQTVSIFLCHHICYRGRRSQGVLHQRRRRLGRQDMGIPRLLLAPVTGIAAAVVCKDLLLLRNDNHLPAEQLLPNQAEGSAAFVADHPVFRQGQYDFLHRKRLHHLVKRPLFLPGVRLDCEVCFRRLRRFMILYRLSLVEQAQLVFTQDIPPLLAGLPELRTLGIGEDLCHVLQLSLELFHLSSQRRVFFL